MTEASQIKPGDYVAYFGSLVDLHDICFVVGVNADGTYELAMDDEPEVVRLHTVRRQSISGTGGRTDRYRRYS
ncbi:hypothetical protein [Amycolatopsis sp. NPDC051128]|uniref:hypothetical protein n=1 Tax=Amycolatopsis sp. NPDC051128 TaxID=3155412 RepID=UPI00342E6891